MRDGLLDPPRLRIGVVLEQKIETGGNFQQSLADLLRLRDWAKSTGDEIIVFTLHRESNAVLEGFGVEATAARLTIWDRAFFLLKLTAIFNFAQLGLRWSSSFERRLKRRGVDLVYFLSQTKWHGLLEDTPFVLTILDNCHRDAPEFPEVRAYGEFERREWAFRVGLAKAVLTIVNSKTLVERLVVRYGVEAERYVVIPFAGSPFVVQSMADPAANRPAISSLDEPYLFYPAQLWLHKNHACILRALALLRQRGRTPPKLVLCGSSRGAEGMVKALARTLDLEDRVVWLGFVPSEDLAALYRGALALVMPTYFGPTNLPPIEAWSLGIPVLYPSAFSDEAGNAAILFDYDDPETLADAIEKVQVPDERKRLVEAGYARLRDISLGADVGFSLFSRHIDQLRSRIAPQSKVRRAASGR